MRDLIFVCYSRKDFPWLSELKTILGEFGDGSRWRMWDDTRVSPAECWRDEIDEALSTAAAAVVLLSPHFFESSFIADYELPPLLKAAQRGELKLFPVVIAACPHERVTGIFQAVHDPARPLAALEESERRAVWNRLGKGLQGVIAAIDWEHQIAAEMLRLRHELEHRPEIQAIDEKIAQSAADHTLEELRREMELCSLEIQRYQLLLTALMEQMQNTNPAPLRSGSIIRAMQEIAEKNARAERRSTDLTQTFSEQTLARHAAAQREHNRPGE